MKKSILFLLLLISISVIAQNGIENPNNGSTNLFLSNYGSGLIAYNVKNFGALGNGVQNYDGSVTASSTTFNSASAHFTSADIGKPITIDSAGASYGRLLDTIATVVSSTQITLNTAPSETISSRMYAYGTDDTHAIQLAINAWYSNGASGKIYFPVGRYIINGPIVGNGYNCQIYVPTLPNPSTSGHHSGVIVFQGEAITPNDASVIALTNAPNNGVILHSFIDGTVTTGTGGKFPTILGTKWDSTNVANGLNYNYVDFYIYDMCFVVRANNASHNGPTMSGVSTAECINDGGNNVQAMIDMPAVYGVQPNNQCAGIITLTSNAGTLNRWTNTLCLGFRYGMIAGEHFSGDEIEVEECWLGLNFEGANHGAYMGRVLIQWCNYSIGSAIGYNGYPLAAQRIVINELDIERMTHSVWYQAVDDIYDSVSNLYGLVGMTVLQSYNTGFAFLPSANGATNLNYHLIQTDALRVNPSNLTLVLPTANTPTYSLRWQNNSTTAYSNFDGINNSGTHVQLGLTGGSYTTNGLYIANQADLYSGAGLLITSTSADIIYAANGGLSTPALGAMKYSTSNFIWGNGTTDYSNARIQSTSTSEAQFGGYYNSSNYFTLQASAAGVLTIAPSGVTVKFVAPTSSAATLNFPVGTYPSSPNQGDMGAVTGHLYYRDQSNTYDFLAFAPLASPTFSGSPSAPTAPPGTSTTQIATTAFVQASSQVLFSQTTAGTTLTNSAAPTNILGTGTSPTNFTSIAANTLQVGQVITVECYVVVSTASSSPGTLSLGATIGGVGNTIGFTPVAGMTDILFDIVTKFTVTATGSSGSISGATTVTTLTAGAGGPYSTATLSSALNTTISNSIAEMATWGSALSGNSIQAIFPTQIRIQ